MTNLLLTDSYKHSHAEQYPPGTSKVYSYFESRGGKYDETVFFGLQYLLKKYLQGAFVKLDDIFAADKMLSSHFGKKFDKAKWLHIVEAHAGRLPVSIRALPEGTVCGNGNAMMTVENTCPQCYWVTNWIETLLVQTWYPTTVATQSRYIRKMIFDFLQANGTPEGIGFKLHDFGFRGVSSVESAGLGGAAHLVNFSGTDTLAALYIASEYYGEACAGFSIPASEHSTITSWGREHEVDAFRNMLEKYPEGLVACVSDSFDIFKACDDLWGTQLKDRILARPGTLVIRPDSGDPISVIMTMLSILGERFGYELNSKGFKSLDPHVRIIQGDGVNAVTIMNIISAMHDQGWSADNIAFGMGGALLQDLNRDTNRFAFKCSSVTVNGEERDVWKDPTTDAGKISKRGRLVVLPTAHGLATFRENAANITDNQLHEVFRDGRLLVDQKFSDVRTRARG